MRNPLSRDQPLDLQQLVSTLLTQGRLRQTCAEQVLITGCNAPCNLLHPLVFLAEQRLQDLSRPGKTLDLETLTAWLAEQCQQPYLRIDPLKIDVASVTGLMSFAFAQRHEILAVAANEQAVTIASAQPWISSWEADLRQVLKRPIKRVIANPQEIQRLSVEFFQLAKSVTGPCSMTRKAFSSTPSNSCSPLAPAIRSPMPTMRTS